jgi:hypothetical protein
VTSDLLSSALRPPHQQPKSLPPFISTADPNPPPRHQNLSPVRTPLVPSLSPSCHGETPSPQAPVCRLLRVAPPSIMAPSMVHQWTIPKPWSIGLHTRFTNIPIQRQMWNHRKWHLHYLAPGFKRNPDLAPTFLHFGPWTLSKLDFHPKFLYTGPPTFLYL